MTSQPTGHVLQLSTAEATGRLGSALGAALVPGLVVALVGDLGAGKTTLSKAAIAHQGAVDADDVVSPTYVLAVEYPGRVETLHIDAYRLEGPDSLLGLGYGPLDKTARAVLVEWADRIRSALPEDRLEIELDHHAGGRTAIVRALGPTSSAQLQALIDADPALFTP
ncbi:tRNA (adenosine(37)-N6)-threonylcarbamoyltransferase complex ATPase subunit type 1 TsaE [Planctomycetota bacterium]|nr:tRNA (adenosine(37)-N6)-threonylcarbamoyltransferase complex ATPase subunit type 1 TsaE [Planctomycetota bacterium]